MLYLSIRQKEIACQFEGVGTRLKLLWRYARTVTIGNMATSIRLPKRKVQKGVHRFLRILLQAYHVQRSYFEQLECETLTW